VTDEPDVPEQMRVRREKRARILASGGDPYPVGVARTHAIAEVKRDYDGLESGQETDDVVGVAGRVVFLRDTGKLIFAAIQDGEGERLQIMLSEARVGEESLAAFKADVDLGDHLFARGAAGKSKRGEVSVFADEWAIAAKALRPLPALHKELSEESRVRQRYVDLIARPLARDTARRRAVVGGIERVFEINRNFRNEGADSSHSPEFSMLEAYEAYGDYDTMATMTRDLIQGAATDVFGGTELELADGTSYDIGGEWKALTLYGSLSEALGAEVTPETGVERLQEWCDDAGVSVDPKRASHGKLVESLWEHHVGSALHAPTFVRDFPVETSPLTRAHRSQPGVVEKWDLYVRGFELATAYSELVDPVIQRARFEEQARLAAAGDDEAMRVDDDFLTAMEYAMPPAGGMGMGIDRLLMALTGLGIRDTILFPLVRPSEEAGA